MHHSVELCVTCITVLSSVWHASQCWAVCDMHHSVEQCVTCITALSSVWHASQCWAMCDMHHSVKQCVTCITVLSCVWHASQCWFMLDSSFLNVRWCKFEFKCFTLLNYTSPSCVTNRGLWCSSFKFHCTPKAIECVCTSAYGLLCSGAETSWTPCRNMCRP
jgi:hypothetical protein